MSRCSQLHSQGPAVQCWFTTLAACISHLSSCWLPKAGIFPEQDQDLLKVTGGSGPEWG